MAQMCKTPPTDMERTMEQTIVIFNRYAGKEGDKATMSFKEFETFMKTELNSFTANQKDPKILEKIMASVDGGVDGKRDNQLNFQEFFNLIGGMMVACHEALLKAPPSQKQPVAKNPPTDMEKAMEQIIRIFQHYAGKKGDKSQMNYTEFEAFMKAELKSFTDNQKDPNIVRKLMESVDGTVDGKCNKELDFQEFMNLIGGMMVACHDSFIAHMKRV
ncbi:S100-A11 [Pelobates cultripes]|uniref:S100-A11 n=1 Tax=Pelobates cultripes TaxID=61616 RepID=A0AAD1TIW8_PELCU|nr:S100-A11 [Pelobates cultripes]